MICSRQVSVRNLVDIPLKGFKTSASFITFNGLKDEKEHLAIVFGDWKLKQMESVPLVRLHSECLTGDVFNSLRCDCGPQLTESLHCISESGGVVLYLRQEGRGIGLYNKLDAYSIQNNGVDTFKANNMLGFEDDTRDYRAAAEMLIALGISKIRLFSNNPDKRQQLEKYGIDVIEQEQTGNFINANNRHYLQAKVDLHGHNINMTREDIRK